MFHVEHFLALRACSTWNISPICAGRKQGAAFHSVQLWVVRYSPAPTIMIDDVGAAEPASGSTVMAKALASTPAGRGGLITVALPWASGLKRPAGMGAPLVGISHSS